METKVNDTNKIRKEIGEFTDPRDYLDELRRTHGNPHTPQADKIFEKIRNGESIFNYLNKHHAQL